MASDVGVPSKASVTLPAISTAPAAKDAKSTTKPVAVKAEPAATEKVSPPAPLSNGATAKLSTTQPEKAAAKPVASKPVASKPVASKSPASKPTASKPTASKAASNRPAKAKAEIKADMPTKAATPSTAMAGQPVDALRGVAEQSLAQARTAFAKSQEATHHLAQGLEASGAVVQSGLKELQLRMAEAVEAQTQAAFNYFRAMAKAHTLSDLIDLQSTELRRGVQRTLGEAKEMSSLAQAIASKATEPVRKAIDHAVESARHSR